MLGLRFPYPLIAIFLILSPALVHAKWSLTPGLYVQEQYDDNIFLSETNEREVHVSFRSNNVCFY